MKKNMKRTVLAFILAVGLVAGTAVAQTGADYPCRQLHGNMMGPGMAGGGMMGMNGNMMGGGRWNQGSWGMGCNGMMGGAMMSQMAPGQQQEFMDQTVDLRKQMMEKRFAYMEAMRKPGTTPQELAGIEKEMLELRAAMMDKMNALQSR